jgi:hypothetical protein
MEDNYQLANIFYQIGLDELKVIFKINKSLIYFDV